MLTRHGKEILPELINMVDKNADFYDHYEKLSRLGVTYLGSGGRRTVFSNKYDNTSPNIFTYECVLKIDNNSVVDGKERGGNKTEISNYIELGREFSKYFVPVIDYDKRNARWLVMPMTKGSVSEYDIDHVYFSLARKNIHMARNHDLKKENMGFHKGLVKIHDYDIPIYKTRGENKYVDNASKYFDNITS
jgi:hypothetical protein